MFTVRAKSGRAMGRYATKAQAEARTRQLARQAEALKGHRFGRGRRTSRSPTGKELEVLLDLAKPVLYRKLTSGNVVYDRAYEALAREGLIRWHSAHPGRLSYEDRYELTSAGAKALEAHRGHIRGIANKYKREAGHSPRRGQRSPSGMHIKHIGGGDYQISDAAAGSLARAVGKKSPAMGYELATVMPNGAEVWLRRVVYRHAVGAPKRGWIWIVALRSDAIHNRDLLSHYTGAGR